MTRAVAIAFACLAGVAPAWALDAEAPGDLVADSGEGVASSTVYAPGMRFPFEELPAFANSQVYGHGGYLGPGGGQCDTENYSFPWRDNFCEERSWETPMCPTGQGHQGQDIRPATCADDTHWAVAAADGSITSVGSYSVILTDDGGRQYRYLHMSMDRLAIALGDRVRAGDRLGLVSNDFGGSSTTIHLHFEIVEFVASVGGMTHVPPYTSLVDAYEAAEEPCAALGPSGGTIDDADRACVQRFGPAAYWREVTGAGEGGRLWWTHGFAADAPSNWARWEIRVQRSGRYRLSLASGSAWRVGSGFAAAREVPVELGDDDGVRRETISFDTAEPWIELGVVTLTAGSPGSLSIFDNTGDAAADARKIIVDALRVVPADDVEPEPDAGLDTGVDARADAGACHPAACSGRTCGDWSPCIVEDACAGRGSRSRRCAVTRCIDDVCSEVSEDEAIACTESPVAETPWVPEGGCVQLAPPCGGLGTQRERRTVCREGVTADQTRAESCRVDVEGRATTDWGAWSSCVDGVSTRTRTVCEGGAERVQPETSACSGDGVVADVGTEPRLEADPVGGSGSGTGCTAASPPRPTSVAWILMLAGRARRRARAAA